jgi:hypothetical protein
MGWLLNLGMLGKGAPPASGAFTALYPHGVMGRARAFAPKTASGVGTLVPYYYRMMM